MTARTPIASTVHEPLGKPGGPGLFHHKGLQLPAYIQHVAHEMLKKGKSESEAIQLAIGIVKRWARGGGGVHPDVQAAAASAVAEWEKDKSLKLSTIVLDLVGPKGYIHGWVRVGMDVTHKDGSRGKVEKYDPNTQTVTADWKTGPRSGRANKSTTKAYHLVQGEASPEQTAQPDTAYAKAAKVAKTASEKAVRTNALEDHYQAVERHADAAELATGDLLGQKATHMKLAFEHTRRVREIKKSPEFARPAGEFETPHRHADRLGNDFLAKSKRQPGEVESHEEVQKRVKLMKDFYGNHLFLHAKSNSLTHSGASYPGGSLAHGGGSNENNRATVAEHHLYNLAVAHPAFHRSVREHLKHSDNTSGIYIGVGGVDGLNGISTYEATHSQTPEGGSGKSNTRTLAQVGGINIQDNLNNHSVTAMGTVPGGSISTAVHEHGHLFDHSVNEASATPEFKAAAAQVRKALGSNLSPYYGPGRQGDSELFAEAYAAYNHSQHNRSDPFRSSLTMANTLVAGRAVAVTPQVAARMEPMRKYFDALLQQTKAATRTLGG